MTTGPRTPGQGSPRPPHSPLLASLLAVRGLPTLAISLAVAFVAVELLYLATAELGVRLLQPSVPALDLQIALWLHSFETPVLTALLLGLTFLGIAPVMLAQVAATLTYLAMRRQPLLAWGLALLMVGEVVLEMVTKTVVHRARPEVFRLAVATGYSFPSGHALASTCFYGFLAFALLWPRSRALGYRVAVVALGLLLPIGIGVSRVYLGVHYPSDVLGGWLGGAIWLTIELVVLHRLASGKTEVAENPDAPRLR